MNLAVQGQLLVKALDPEFILCLCVPETPSCDSLRFANTLEVQFDLTLCCRLNGWERLPETLPEALAAIKIIGSSWPARHPHTPSRPVPIWRMSILLQLQVRTVLLV